MKKLAVSVLILILAGTLGGVSAAEPQPLFDLNFLIRVSPVQLNGSEVWIGSFSVHAVLKDPLYRAYFDHLAANNTTRAREEFRDFVRQLVYGNLKDNFERRFEEVNLSGTIYLPEGGPVRVGDNWSATVSFAISNFLVSTDGKVLRCPLSGNLQFVFKGHVFDYTWDRMTVVLPRNYEIKNLAPRPDDFSKGVAIWTNGSYIPLIELYTPAYTFLRYINSTHKSITLSFDPEDGYLRFNATFDRVPEYDSTVEYLLRSFKETMDVVSIDTLEKNGTLIVVGIARPEVAYRETSKERVWQVMVKLPGRFDEIRVTAGTYQLAPDNTVIITVIEKKSGNRVYYLLGGALTVGVAAFFFARRRRKNSKEPENKGETPVDELVDVVSLEEGE